MEKKISIYLDQHPQGGVVIEYPLSAIDKKDIHSPNGLFV
jgi:hypothetical protein